MQITHPLFAIFCLLPLQCTEACIPPICSKPKPRPTLPPTSKPWSTPSPTSTPTPTPTPRPRPSTTPSLKPNIPTIPPVINPNEDDKPVNFVCTISTPQAEPLCSATIISLHFVVSSCLCLQENMQPREINNTRILIGGSSEYHSIIGQGLYYVEQVVLHPYCFYNDIYSLKHDIGLAMTHETIDYTNTMGAANIPEQPGYQPNKNKNWLLSAFRTDKILATSLLESVWFVKVRYVPPKICSEVLNASFYDYKHNYCTPYHHVGGVGTCQADIGASLSLDNYLIGILIHKYQCGGTGSAASYVNVAIHRLWLNEIVEKLSNFEESV